MEGAGLSSTVENYLKALFTLGEGADGSGIPLGRIAERLEVTPGTVTTMMRHLKERGFVEY